MNPIEFVQLVIRNKWLSEQLNEFATTGKISNGYSAPKKDPEYFIQLNDELITNAHKIALVMEGQA
jgi:hypothetical protein